MTAQGVCGPYRMLLQLVFDGMCATGSEPREPLVPALFQDSVLPTVR